MSEFKDHFSGHAAQYAAARPVYPKALIDSLTALCEDTELAWDCGCGNGQVARALAKDFNQVYASDASIQQIEHAPHHPKIQFVAEAAELPSLSDHSVDLITVAQAAHWLDLNAFYPQVNRVLKTHGVLAVWCYGLNLISEEIDALIMPFYRNELGPYWPPERALIESAYRDLPFPFKPIRLDRSFEMRVDWTAEQYAQYLLSWSATQRYISDRQSNPVDIFLPQLKNIWGPDTRVIRWPIHLRLGQLE